MAARKLILASGDRRSLQVRRVLQMLDQRQAEKTAGLGRLWLEFDRAGAADRWLNYLAVYAGRARRQ